MALLWLSKSLLCTAEAMPTRPATSSNALSYAVRLCRMKFTVMRSRNSAGASFAAPSPSQCHSLYASIAARLTQCSGRVSTETCISSTCCISAARLSPRQSLLRTDAEQLSLGVEHVEHREEIVLVGAAAMEEHEQPLRLASCRSGAVDEAHRVALVSLLGKAALARTLRAYELDLREPALDADGELPHMRDFFSISFRTTR